MCEHTDCFTCPYPDCIASDKEIQILDCKERMEQKKKEHKPIVAMPSKTPWAFRRVEYQREYYQAHKEKHDEAMRIWRQENREKCRQYNKEYRKRKKALLCAN